MHVASRRQGLTAMVLLSLVERQRLIGVILIGVILVSGEETTEGPMEAS